MFFLLTVPGAPPTNTTGSALNSTHVLLTWDPPPSDQINGVILGYRINITELNTGATSDYIANETEAVIGPLHPHYNYNFTVVAFTEVGQGPTTYVVVRTAEAGMYSIYVCTIDDILQLLSDSQHHQLHLKISRVQLLTKHR